MTTSREFYLEFLLETSLLSRSYLSTLLLFSTITLLFHLSNQPTTIGTPIEVVFTTINPKNILQKKPVLVKILRTFKDSYDFEYSYVGETTKQKGNATILE